MSAEGFLTAIGNDPDDDTARLVYADWLDDCNHADRAELIRVQCELARWVPDLRRRTELQERERWLLAAHSTDWFEPLRALGASVEYERGFPTITLLADPLKRDRQWCDEVAYQCEQSEVQTVRLFFTGSESWLFGRSPHILHYRTQSNARRRSIGAAWREWYRPSRHGTLVN